MEQIYTVEKGQINFRPLESFWPVFQASGFTVEGEILPGGWSSKLDWSYEDADTGEILVDKDRYDAQKIKGITHFFSPNNKRSLMLAFNLEDDTETYSLTAYTNDEKRTGKAFLRSEKVPYVAGQRFKCICVMGRRKAKYQIYVDDELKLEVIHPFKRARTVREVGTYAGGADNAAGPYGGEARKRMQMRLNFNITKK